MKAIILAAGRGSRMLGLTEARPKCLTPIAGKPLIEWQMAALSAGGISELAVVTGYKSELLENYFEKTFHNERWSETNMVASLMCADEWLSSDACIISYSDIVYHPSIIQKLRKSSFDFAITYDQDWKSLWELRFDDPSQDAESFVKDDANTLVSIGAKVRSIDEIQGQYMGLLKIEPHIWKQLKSLVLKLSSEKRDKLDMTSLIQMALESSMSVGAVEVAGRWCEVDSESDLKIYEEELMKPSKPWSHDWRW